MEHKENIAKNLRHQADIAAHNHQIHESYAALRPAVIDASLPNPTPSNRSNLFDDLPDLLAHNPDNEDDDDIFAPLDHPIIPAGIEPLFDDPTHERERLQRAVELMMMQAEHDDEIGGEDADDDATVTNVTANLRSLGELYIDPIKFYAYHTHRSQLGG